MAGWGREDEAKEARGDGRDARLRGLPLAANPHPPGSRAWSAFDEGWRFEDAFPRLAAAAPLAAAKEPGMPITLYAEFANADTLTGVDIEAAREGDGATLYLRHAAEAAGAERALAISLAEFDAVAREVARFRTLQTADQGAAP